MGTTTPTSCEGRRRLLHPGQQRKKEALVFSLVEEKAKRATLLQAPEIAGGPGRTSKTNGFKRLLWQTGIRARTEAKSLFGALANLWRLTAVCLGLLCLAAVSLWRGESLPDPLVAGGDYGS
jgi:hypothetical protein